MNKLKPYYNYYMSGLLIKLAKLVIYLEKTLAKLSSYLLNKAKSFIGSI